MKKLVVVPKFGALKDEPFLKSVAKWTVAPVHRISYSPWQKATMTQKTAMAAQSDFELMLRI